MDERDEKMSNLYQIAREIAEIQTKISNGQMTHSYGMDRLCQIACDLELDQLLLLDEITQDMLKNVDSDENF